MYPSEKFAISSLKDMLGNNDVSVHLLVDLCEWSADRCNILIFLIILRPEEVLALIGE